MGSCAEGPDFTLVCSVLRRCVGGIKCLSLFHWLHRFWGTCAACEGPRPSPGPINQRASPHGVTQHPTPSQHPCLQQVSRFGPGCLELSKLQGRWVKADVHQLRASLPSQTFPGWGELTAFGVTLFPSEMTVVPTVIADVLFRAGITEVLLPSRYITSGEMCVVVVVALVCLV